MSSFRILMILQSAFVPTATPMRVHYPSTNDTLRAVPDGRVVRGTLIHGYVRQFVGRNVPCYWDSTRGFARQPAGITDQVIVVPSQRDSILVRTTQRHWAADPDRHDTASYVDTTVYDRRTLGLRWTRWHIGTHSSGYAVEGTHWSWLYIGPEPSDTERHDSTFAQPGFFEGSEDLLVQALPALDNPRTVVQLPFISFDRYGSRLTSYSLNAHVTGLESVRVPTGPPRQAWVVTVGDDPSLKIQGTKYWIDKATHELLMWFNPEDPEAEACPVKYTQAPR